MTQPAVKVANLTKRFGDFTAVNDLSFSIQKGEIYGLLGVNGAGKTTTISMLLNLITPTSGQIEILGYRYPKGREDILSRVNFTSAYISLPLRLTVWENMKVFAALYSVKNPKKHIYALLERFEMTHALNKRVGELSAGQKTRVYLSKALLNDPDILFLDEPTASLDPDMADKTRQVLLEVQKERGTTVLITSHNMAEMESLCNRILLINRGSKLMEGTPPEILAHYGHDTLEEVFIYVARGGGQS